MTSKSPVRSCEDVDETTLSYAEVKALCAGNPLIKEKIDLEVSLSKLKTLKSHHRNEQYRLEDNVLKYFPEAIRKTENRIKGYESDTEHLKTLVTPADNKMSVMTIMGTDYTEKEAAGKALIEVSGKCKAKETLDLGDYKGFDMAVTFDKYNNVFTLELKRDMSYTTTLGADPIGNITRINNLLSSIQSELEYSTHQRETLKSELAIAKGELGKPFPREAELTEKTARLAQLNALLNLDGKKEVQQDIAAKTPPSKTSIYAKMEEFKQRKTEQSQPEKSVGLNRNKDKEIS
jgi:hypothetical protein